MGCVDHRCSCRPRALKKGTIEDVESERMGVHHFATHGQCPLPEGLETGHFESLRPRTTTELMFLSNCKAPVCPRDQLVISFIHAKQKGEFFIVAVYNVDTTDEPSL